LFDVSLRPPEPTDQEISVALLCTWEILRRVHGSQKVVLRDLPIEGGDQARETFRANHGINFEFLHFLSSPYRESDDSLAVLGCRSISMGAFDKGDELHMRSVSMNPLY